MLLLVGFLIVTVGVVGMYVGRIFEQMKGRPLFIIDARTSDSAFSAGLPQLEPERASE